MATRQELLSCPIGPIELKIFSPEDQTKLSTFFFFFKAAFGHYLDLRGDKVTAVTCCAHTVIEPIKKKKGGHPLQH